MRYALSAALALLPCVLAAPAAAPAAAPHHPMITPKAVLAERSPEAIQRDIGSYLNSVISGLGSDVPSFVTNGILPVFQSFPSGSAVQSALSISDSDLAATPTRVLNLPGYANWTDAGWNLRVHGNVYKKPNISQSKLDDLANGFLIGTSISNLTASEQDQARNLTAEIYVVQQPKVNVTFDLVNNYVAPKGFDGGLIAAKGGAQKLVYPQETTDEGDFDMFLTLANTTGPSGGYLLPGNATVNIQALNIYAEGTDTGNASAYLVPTKGYTIISDIDDILRITKIYEPAQGLLNSFAKPFVPWMNMPEIYANWSSSLPDFHFHYLTTTPEQITANYMDFIYKTYPLGSFDTRPLNFSDLSATLSIRKFLLEKIIQTYPQRKFILIADTSNADVMKDYPTMFNEFPGQIACIFLRNTSSTDPGDQFPYDTSYFGGINSESYMFFNVPDDLKGLDIANGQCLNKTIPQNVTFGEQGLPDGISTSGSNTTKNSTAGLTMAPGKGTMGMSFGMAFMAAVLGWGFSAL